MTAKISLNDRRRSSELSHKMGNVNQEKKDQLLALKLQALNDAAEATGKLFDLPIQLVCPDPHQPRKVFKNIDSLAKSIQEQGILQPIVVRPKNTETGFYQIIVGERRYQAAKLAGLGTLPCVIREQADVSTLILQLLENDQREQVSVLEEAHALRQLIHEMGLSQQALAKELGRDGPWISLRLGLLDAPQAVKCLIEEGVVHDLRTLHELRKLHEEDPSLFSKVEHQLRTGQFQGSHRELLRQTRESKQVAAVPRVLKMEYEAGSLCLFVEKKRNPLIFKLDPELLSSLFSFLK